MEFTFDRPFEPFRNGRIMRWRQVRPLHPLGLRISLQEKHGESMEIELPPGHGPKDLLDGLDKLENEFVARFPTAPKRGEHRRGNRQQPTQAA